MRTCAVLIASVLLAVTAATSYGRADYVIRKISPSVVITPQYSITLGTTPPTGKNQQWIQVEVDFQSTVPWTDELTFRYYILLAGACLTGEVTHVDIPAGRDLYSVMYVAPHTIDKVLKGRALASLDIENVGVEIVNQGQVLTMASFKNAGYGQAQWWQSMQQVTGRVLNKNQTPFGPLFWDRYEQIKIPAGAQ